MSNSVELILSGKIGVMAIFLRKYLPFYDLIPFSENVKLKHAADITTNVVTEVRIMIFYQFHLYAVICMPILVK